MNYVKKALVVCSVIGAILSTGMYTNAKDILLKEGMQGEDVKQVQISLKQLGYFDSQSTGYFGSATKDAVKKFQKDRNFSVDGVVGPATWSSLVGNNEIKEVKEESKKAEPSIPVAESLEGTLTKGMQGEQVKKLQKRLKDLELFNYETTGYFGDATETAVEKFQKNNGILADGIVGNGTWNRLFNVSNAKINERATVVSRGSSQRAQALVSWGEAENIFTIGTVATVTDINTGISFKIKRTYGESHADCETLTDEDTDKMKKAYGGTLDWTRRPIIVTVNGRQLAASMAGLPHAGVDSQPANAVLSKRSGGYGKGQNLDAVKGNEMSGVFDIHFYKSKTHGSDRIDEEHQGAVKKAANYIEQR